MRLVMVVVAIVVGACARRTSTPESAIATKASAAYTITFAPRIGARTRRVDTKSETSSISGHGIISSVMRRRVAHFTLESVGADGVERERASFEPITESISMLGAPQTTVDDLGGKVFTIEHGLDDLRVTSEDGTPAPDDTTGVVRNSYCALAPERALTRFLASRSWMLGDAVNLAGADLVTIQKAGCREALAHLTVTLVDIDDAQATFSIRAIGAEFEDPEIKDMTTWGFGAVRVSTATGAINDITVTTIMHGQLQGADFRMVDFLVAHIEPEPPAP